ncbi:unnamed protein product [Cylindrotheca closterium]|uniref:Uncharacterized protein n=1 Tax=Cylindrotheca closterium TaxID=2856 RepID=A0AAD2FZH2_9STRA|nr:unnamed protein product [Cylindrotheca closterium]
MENTRYMVKLSDGRSMNIGSNHGANAFLRAASKIDHFSFHVNQINGIRRKKRINDIDSHKIIKHIEFFNSIARADPDLFREKVPQSEIKCWLDFIVESIKKMSTDSKWISTGLPAFRDIF